MSSISNIFKYVITNYNIKFNGISSEPVECGTTIRLQHLSTGKYLHSHLFSSPLSNNQEVSAFGENSVGDSGDNWRIVCDGDFWERGDEVAMKHSDTDAYLSTSGQAYGRPINGQLEIVGIFRNDASTKWQAAEGIFIHESNFNPKQQQNSRPEHSEL